MRRAPWSASSPAGIFPGALCAPGRGGLSDRCQLILTMQSVGLASRLAAIHGKVAVVGLSGGLDSTLALLVTARAFDRLGLPREGIHALSMALLRHHQPDQVQRPAHCGRAEGQLPGGFH